MTYDELQRLLADLALLESSVETSHSAYVSFSLPLADGADYQFQCFLEEDGEPQMAANRSHAERDEYFWYRVFEIYDYENEAARTVAFSEVLAALVNYRSRIIQKKGWFSWSFTAEVDRQGQWEAIGSNSILRPVRVPRIAGRTAVYESAPIAPGS